MSRRNMTMRIAILILALARAVVPEQVPVPSSDLFQQRAPGIELNEQSIVDGIAMLIRGTSLAVSVEFKLGATISSPAPPVKTLTANVGPGTISEVLDQLCALDPTFTWVRNGNTVNVLPTVLANDPHYFLNRRIDELTFQDVREADTAVMEIARQLPGPTEQIAVLQTGVSVSFARPWRGTLMHLTVRQAINEIAQQLGPTYGWQFSGADDFRMLTFHEGLLPRPSRKKQK
jgi:hypothetical protein